MQHVNKRSKPRIEIALSAFMAEQKVRPTIYTGAHQRVDLSETGPTNTVLAKSAVFDRQRSIFLYSTLRTRRLAIENVDPYNSKLVFIE